MSREDHNCYSITQRENHTLYSINQFINHNKKHRARLACAGAGSEFKLEPNGSRDCAHFFKI